MPTYVACWHRAGDAATPGMPRAARPTPAQLKHMGASGTRGASCYILAILREATGATGDTLIGYG